MPTCRTCNNFFMGSECPTCRIKRLKMNDPKEIAKRQEEQRQREEVERQRANAQRLEEERRRHYQDLSDSFLMTTGNSFSGYEITGYLGIISEGAVQGTGWLSELSADFNDFFGTESNTFAYKMKLCREAALEKAKKSAIMKGANALISIDFETMTFKSNMIGIMVAGTAVRVEKSTT